MLKTSLTSLALVAALFGSGELMAQACNTNAWGVDLGAGQGVAGSPTAGSPATGVVRYSGRCGLLSDAAGDFVRDGSPANEPTYIARFYVRPNVTTGPAVIFQALDDATPATPSLQVSYNSGQLTFNAIGATASSTPVTAGAWYSVEVNWTAGGTMTYRVKGNQSGGTEGASATGTLTGVTAGAQVDSANLGWISGGSGGTITTDAFESRRTQPIGRLCRGDANNSGGIISSSDRFAITQDIGGTLQPGQVDCNESGSVTSSDRFCVTQLITANANCTTPNP